MSDSIPSLAELVARLSPADPRYATHVVDALLDEAVRGGASDVHLQPTAEGLQLQMRIDGVLRPVALLPTALAPNVIARLKVQAELLTYRTEVPQEGRIRLAAGNVETRVSTFPTLHGEKAVVRLFGGAGRFHRLADLGLPADAEARLGEKLRETSGAILVTGPAGSGKTTTAYACLREIAQTSLVPRSLVSLEDPIETAVAGVAQTQVNLAAGLDLATGLRFLLRQDPEVILVGEIRDRATAEAALQASLTGHLVVSTFHAGSAAESIGRLADMGIEPYILRSGLLAILNQRLLRRVCPECARETTDTDAFLGLPVTRARISTGCPACGHSGHRGRFLLAELLLVERTALGRALLDRLDSSRLEQLAVQSGMTTRWQRALAALADGLTTPAEVRRVLGWSGP